jgi:cytochrome c1
MTRRRQTGVVLALAAAVLGAAGVAAQPPSPPARTPKPAPGGDPHAEHGTPKGWRFTWPKGDVARGRAAFARFECYSCHEVKGEKFPAPREAAKLGPELSVMGPLHDVDYFAESILNPSAVIERGKGYQAPDGSSKMPSFNDSMTVQELIDLVAYLRALKPPRGAPVHRGH